MKTTILFFAIMLLPVLAWAQESDEDFKTVLDNRTIGGYGAFSVGYTQIEGKNAVLLGARGGVVIGHSFSVGLGGAGFINEYEYNNAEGKDYSLAGGYGGIYFEPIVAPKFPVHMSFPMLFGVGGVATTTWDRTGNDIKQVNDVLGSASFLVFEPAAEIEFNVVKFFRLAVYASYRFTTEIDVPLVEDKTPLDSYSVGMTFKFGKF